MYIIFVSRVTTGGSNLLVRLGFSPCDSNDELGVVYGLYLLDLGQTVFVTDVAWAALCAGWGNRKALVYTPWGFSMTPVASGLSKCVHRTNLISSPNLSFLSLSVTVSGWVEIFFALRLWSIGRNTFWKTVTAVVVAVRTGVHTGQWYDNWFSLLDRLDTRRGGCRCRHQSRFRQSSSYSMDTEPPLLSFHKSAISRELPSSSL
jgi:hypothetical protein